VFSAVFVPWNSEWGVDLAGILSFLVASLIVGYLFAVKIQEESRRGAIGRILVLFVVVLMFAQIGLLAANPYMEAAMNEELENMFSTSGWTTKDWVGYSQFALVTVVAVNVLIALVFGFIGLDAGSMLRKPERS